MSHKKRSLLEFYVKDALKPRLKKRYGDVFLAALRWWAAADVYAACCEGDT